MANQAVLEKVLADEEFVKELAEMETLEEVRDALNAKGAEITVEEVRQIAKSLSAQAQAEGELDEDALEDVAGGAGSIDFNLVGVPKYRQLQAKMQLILAAEGLL